MNLFAGGDRRAYWAVCFLREQGFPLHCRRVPGLEDDPIPDHISLLLLPFPVADSPETLQELLPSIDRSTLVLGGKFGSQRSILEHTGARIMDLYNTEPLTTMNAAATAEGALCLLIESSEVTLAGSQCLIIGGGRIGMLLGERLRALGGAVTLAARSEADRAMIRAHHFVPEETGIYQKGLSQYDFIINTVPAPVLNREQLSQIRPDCVLLELASAPGGFSSEDCRCLGLKWIPGPGLPGRFSPKTAGVLYGESLFDAIKKEGIL